MARWEVLLVVCVGCAFGGYEIGKRKGLPGLILGLLVGMVGVITAACALRHGRRRSRWLDQRTRLIPTEVLKGNV